MYNTTKKYLNRYRLRKLIGKPETKTAAILTICLTFATTGCSDGSDATASSVDDSTENVVEEPTVAVERIVGFTDFSLVDNTRVTAAHDSVPEASERVIRVGCAKRAESPAKKLQQFQ